MSFRQFYTGALRTAIQLQDLRCQHPSGCDAPIDECDIDHHLPFAKDGRTTATNGGLYCEPHNRIPDLRHPKRC